MKFQNREVNQNSNHRVWKFKDFVLTVNVNFTYIGLLWLTLYTKVNLAWV